MFKKVAFGLGLIILVTAIFFWSKNWPGGGLPGTFKRQANFPLYYPSGDFSPFTIDQKTLKLSQPEPKDKDTQVFSFVLVAPDNQVTFTEQVAPDLVSEQIGLDKLASLMQAYREVITSLGRVELTRPKELNGGQTAVAAPNFTTLIFAKPQKDLDESQWRKIFSSLELVK